MDGVALGPWISYRHRRHGTIKESGELAALAHPLRPDLINHLMASGPATASQRARAVGEAPPN